MLKFIHGADFHLDSAFGALDSRRAALRRAELRETVVRLSDYVNKHDIRLVLLAGDIFDGIPGRESVDAVKQALADCVVPVFVSPGNHDFCGIGSPWVEETWPENVHVFKGGMTSIALPELDCRVYGAGYSSMDCPPLLTHFQAQGQQTHCIAVLHGDPMNLSSPYCPVTAAQIRESGLSYLALGHIHKAGSLIQGKTLCGWPGSPMGRGWDETGEKGIYLVELEEEASVRFLPLDTPVFWDLEADVTEDAAAGVAAVLPAAESGDYFRITLTGAADVDVQDLQRSFARFPNLTLRDRTDPPVDVWADAGEDTFRGVYFGLLRELAETDETAALTAEISCRILSGREVALP